jgi:bifunctional non-homologous end joining protein LigD
LSPVTPFEPIPTQVIPKGDQWIGQIKWDGVRILTYYDGHQVALFNRKKNERTMHYPELTAIDTYCTAHSVILDGEVVALENGKPSFHQVMKRDALRKKSNIDLVQRQVPITYMVFDILYLNNKWMMNRPLHERQQLLSLIIEPNEFVQLVKSDHDPEALFEAVKEHDLEGIVIKDLESRYAINGKDKRWQKKKVFKDLCAVAGGVTFRQNRVNALLLGLYDDEGCLWYVGHAGTGKLTQNDWLNITQMVPALKITERPFVNRPDRHKDAVWIQPKITVKINFLEWTQSKTLRQPSIQAIVQADAKACTFNQT